MNGQVDRAAALLFPEHGRRARDVKFFFQSGATAEALAEQVIVSLAALEDDSCTIGNVDQGLTVQPC